MAEIIKKPNTADIITSIPWSTHIGIGKTSIANVFIKIIIFIGNFKVSTITFHKASGAIMKFDNSPGLPPIFSTFRKVDDQYENL